MSSGRALIPPVVLVAASHYNFLHCSSTSDVLLPRKSTFVGLARMKAAAFQDQPPFFWVLILWAFSVSHEYHQSCQWNPE